MKYYKSAEDFLSVYMGYKLKEGGDPFVTSEELKFVVKELLNSSYCYESIEESIKNFDFDNLEELNAKFQSKASMNRDWLKHCFEYKDNKLIATHNFFDYTDTTYGQILSFLSKYVKPSILKNDNIKLIDKEDINVKNAKVVARYLTEIFAQKYINKEVKYGRWPTHLAKPYYLLEKNLSKYLELKCDKNYFSRFYKYISAQIYNMLVNNEGKLVLSDKLSATLKYNNLKRLILPFNEMVQLCSSYYDKVGDNKFDIVIEDGVIKCNETKLVYDDPFEAYSDEYESEEIILNNKR